MSMIYNYQGYQFLPNTCPVDSQLAFKFFNKMEDFNFWFRNNLQRITMISQQSPSQPLAEYKIILTFWSECLKVTHRTERVTSTCLPHLSRRGRMLEFYVHLNDLSLMAHQQVCKVLHTHMRQIHLCLLTGCLISPSSFRIIFTDSQVPSVKPLFLILCECLLPHPRLPQSPILLVQGLIYIQPGFFTASRALLLTQKIRWSSFQRFQMASFHYTYGDFYFRFVSFLFETGSYYVALAVLVLIIQTRLVSNSQRSACLCRLSASIKGMSHHAGYQ